MTTPIVGTLALNRKPIAGRLADALQSFTLELSTTAVSQITLGIIDPGLKLMDSNQFIRGNEITWSIGSFSRHLVIATSGIEDGGDIEIMKLECRPAAVEFLRNFYGATTWSGISPTEWLASECAGATELYGGRKINFVGQPTMSRTQIVRRAEKGALPESSWDVAGALAAEEGFWLFENADTVYFGAPSWFALDHVPGTIDQWTWPRPPDGKTPLLKIPTCRASDYAQAGNLQPATIDATVAMEYALSLSPSQAIKVVIPNFRGRYLVTKVTVQAGEALAKVTIESPVDPTPHTNMVTVNSKSSEGFDPATTALTPLQVGAYFYNGMIQVGATPTVENISIAIAIAFRESQFIPTQHNDVPPDDSWGLWQINVLGGIHTNVKTGYEALTHSQIPNWPDALTDPAINGFGTALLSGGGKNWKPWSTYNHNDYLSYLTAAQSIAPLVMALPLKGVGAEVQVPESPSVDAGASNPTVERFVQFALSKRGDKYVLGSAGANDTFDCSGLVYAALLSVGVAGAIPRTARAQYEWCKSTNRLIRPDVASKVRGSVLFRVDSGETDHVVISLGDGIHTIEAMGSAYGVVEGTIGNRFDHAGLLPPLDYPVRSLTNSSDALSAIG